MKAPPSIALLTRYPAIISWFKEDYPFVTSYDVMDAEIWNHQVIVLVTMNQIEGEVYQILDIWKRYMQFYQDSHKLALLGWLPNKGNFDNYLQIGKMPADLVAWARGAKTVEELIAIEYSGMKGKKKPIFPQLLGHPLKGKAGSILASHGEVTFQASLIKLRGLLTELEAYAADHSIESWFQTEDGQHAIQWYRHTLVDWEEGLPFFQLMPDYPELCQFLDIKEDLRRLFDHKMLPENSLSLTIEDYLEEIVTEITEFYEMDKKR